MMTTTARLFLTMVLLGLAAESQGQGDPSSQCQQQEAEQRKACFESRGLDLATMPTNLDVLHPLYAMLQSTFTMMDPGVHCSDVQQYSEATRCAINVTKNCYDPDGTRNVIMNPDDVITGMGVLCDRSQEVDMECFKNFYVMVEGCTQYHRRASNFINSVDPTDIMCAKEDLMYDCMQVIMTPMCGENTTNVFLEQMDRYTVNPSCVPALRPSRERPRYFPILTATTDHHQEEGEEEGDGDGGADHLTPFLSMIVVPSVTLWVLGRW